jgi:hypothetical protein
MRKESVHFKTKRSLRSLFRFTKQIYVVCIARLTITPPSRRMAK